MEHEYNFITENDGWFVMVNWLGFMIVIWKPHHHHNWLVNLPLVMLIFPVADNILGRHPKSLWSGVLIRQRGVSE